jgi:valine--pyruvate aminotransferase
MKSFSRFGQKFAEASGIAELMQDLGEAISKNDPETCMLGGGNPAIIPEASDIFQQEMQHLQKSGQFENTFAYYSSPEGHTEFIGALVEFLNNKYQWNLSTKNISLTNGSQNSFFYLFNALAGEMSDGSTKKILFPLSPEYMGYRELGLSDNILASQQPTIEHIDDCQFKYHIDFDALTIDNNIAAIAVSRPTNPTGNIITDKELAHLDKLAKQHNIPLIIDSAYGSPFPNTIYTDAKTLWNENIILGLSLSKLGLPGLRTGIIIANEKITALMTAINGTLSLSPNNMGASLTTRLIKTGEIDHLSQKIIQPYYQQKMQKALAIAHEIFATMPVYIHKPEGAFFLWLWFKNLPISSKEFYQRLKLQKVLVIPGEDFFFDMPDNWAHQRECIRINYACPEEQLRRGLTLIKEELLKL